MARQKIWKMSELAGGHNERWIRQQYNAAIKAANDRIKTLQKTEYAGKAQAYQYYVKGDLAGAPYTKERGGATVFKALPRGSGRQESLEALRMVERFLGAKTSTASGILEVEKEREKGLQDMLDADFKIHGQTGSKAPQMTKEEKDAVLRWMGSEEGRAAKASFDSHQVREAIAKAVIASRHGRSGGSAPSVNELFQAFDQSQQTLADWIAASENVIGGYI